ncbi:MAG TPA: GAF domain-containing protein, partial [Blastocatellia bacterium]|nr:GAF domain-containing protein [Blastocatellia bacterium]
ERDALCCEASRHSLLRRNSPSEVCADDAGTLQDILKSGDTRIIQPGGAEQRSVVEGEPVRTAMFAPIRHRSRVVGVLEAINKIDGSFDQGDVALLAELGTLVAPILTTWRDQEAASGGMLKALTRLTLLYDVTQSFNSTILFDELAPIICDRTANVMDVESSSLWLVSNQDMICRAILGRYLPDIIGYSEVDARTAVGEMLRDDAPLVINSPDDPRLARRLPFLDNRSVNALICAPVKHEGQWLGALEIINKRDGSKFSEADAHLLSEVATQAANSIRNAQRHEAERKVKELHALLRTSREITSSLDLDRMLAVVVNQTATIIPFDRCAIALLTKGRYTIEAIAGEAQVNWKDPKVKEWNEIIGWAGESGAEIYVSEENGEINSERAETRE